MYLTPDYHCAHVLVLARFTTAQPGLTFDEAQSQFVLWAVMKAPLMLGAHWSTLATMKTDFPEYYGLVVRPTRSFG